MAGPWPPDIVKLLRSAGVVRIYEAELASGIKVVVKQLDPLQADNDQLGVWRFGREKQLAAVLRHPSLPCVVASGDNWLAFEHLGRSLAEPVTARQFSHPLGVRNLLRQLAAVLAYIHARGVVHGDIKPAHLMFRGEVPVLIDFGIAGLSFGDPLADLELAGTPAWMAPEQVGGSKPGPASDIWSLSALCLWMLTGTRPFSGKADEILDDRRRGAAPEFELSSAGARQDPGLLALLQSGLGPAESRPTSADIVNFLSVR